MYNRYIPQSDGTYKKSSCSEPAPSRLPDQADSPAFSSAALPPAASRNQAVSMSSFFKNLLPRGLDTEDLIVILLLLLISEQNGSEGNQAMLTLGAYLFL